MGDPYMSIPVSEFEALHDLAEKAERERDERLTRESGQALVAEANRWERLYQEANDEATRLHNLLAKIDALLGDPSGSPLDAINLARNVIRERSE